MKTRFILPSILSCVALSLTTAVPAFAENLLESLSFAEITILYLIQERFPTLCTIA